MKFFTGVVLGVSLCCAQALANETKDLEGFGAPESVFVDSNFIYVSNIGAKPEPLAKDNDGFISKLDKNGKFIERAFIQNLNAPKGMARLDNRLFVVDIDTLYAFDVNSKKQSLKLPISGAVFLNDIAVLDSKTLLISDTGTGIIHKINLTNNAIEEFYKLDLSEFGGGNGLAIDKQNNALIIAGYHPDGVSGGKVVRLNLASKKLETLLETKGAYDGVAVLENGDILVSSWGENLQGVIYRISKGKVSALELPFLQGPADFFVDKNTLYIPKMLENKVLKVELK
ncbi:ATP-binding protein [Helicobacter sp. MIT 00-7814]|uniref:ATP-binding protein n=1 Tax=unclassified Helicobacter TaxID=2593540 RepID=UPI000E1EBE14|nr:MULTISPECIES: ATP-binding protein [unclassified Helicobacter]RDU55082.1 ATP-binding protein [Helicobacter sp. MIT 99-10781]RDU56901.1 ATP-binding protein [Helicobacter sp. MIT 00-7814]